MKTLTMDYVIACLMHEILKRKENEPQGEEVAVVLRHNKGNNSFPQEDRRSCFYCGRPCHIVRFVIKQKTKSTYMQKLQKTIMTTHL